MEDKKNGESWLLVLSIPLNSVFYYYVAYTGGECIVFCSFWFGLFGAMEAQRSMPGITCERKKCFSNMHPGWNCANAMASCEDQMKLWGGNLWLSIQYSGWIKEKIDNFFNGSGVKKRPNSQSRHFACKAGKVIFLLWQGIIFLTQSIYFGGQHFSVGFNQAAHTGIPQAGIVQVGVVFASVQDIHSNEHFEPTFTTISDGEYIVLYSLHSLLRELHRVQVLVFLYCLSASSSFQL